MPLPNGLTPKQNGFLKDYLETGNGTQAALNNYDTTSEETAAAIAWENLRKPQIIAQMQSWAERASCNIMALADAAESEQVKLAANKDILDRTGFKPVEKTESKVQSDVTLSSSEELLIMANELAKKIKDV